MKIFIIFSIVFSIFTFSQEESVAPLNLLSATQNVIGKERVIQKIKKYKDRWQDAYPDKQFSFENYIIKEVIPSKNVPVIRGPNGRYYLLDGHHRNSAYIEILKELDIFDQVEIPVTIIDDYQGKSFSEFADGIFEKHGKGYIHKSIDTKEMSNLEKFTLLPKNLDQLEDFPIRSLVGAVFDEFELRKELMNDYVEFYVAEMIDTKFNGENLFSRKNVKKMKKAIFKNSTIVEFMLTYCRSEQSCVESREQVQKVLNELNYFQSKKSCPKKLRKLLKL